jgi:hypothetical protein
MIKTVEPTQYEYNPHLWTTFDVATTTKTRLSTSVVGNRRRCLLSCLGYFAYLLQKPLN